MTEDRPTDSLLGNTEEDTVTVANYHTYSQTQETTLSHKLRNPAKQIVTKENTDSTRKNSTSENGCTISSVGNGTLWLTFALRLFLFSPIKWKRGALWISLFHLVWCVVYIVKIIYVTWLTFQIGQCRESVSSSFEDGYIALHHTLLQKWDASFETVPYPPSQGKFAVYNTDDLRNRINFAVEKFYNAEFEATGYFKKLPDDDISIHVVYFILIDNPENHTLKDVHTNVQRNFKPDMGLSTHRDAEGNNISSYNVTTDLNNNNLSSVLNRVLEVNISFSLHSLRVDKRNNDARCLQIFGNVSFNDEDHSGQVKVVLNTKTVPIHCKKMNYSLVDSPQCRHYSEEVATIAEVLAFITVIGDGFMFLGGIISLCITFKYMKTNYKSVYGETSEGQNLPPCEYIRNIKWWHIPSIAGDILTLLGVQWIIGELGDNHDLENQLLHQWDKHVVYIGSGCLLAWFSVLRFIKVNHKFTLLFKTIKKSAFDVIFFLFCVTIIFVGFWSCAYVVLGPYNVKFKEGSTTAETLFSMINGDEIFATFALLQEEYAGDVKSVWIFSRIIIYGYVTIFTVLVFNLLIALFNSAYEVVKNSYEKEEETPQDSTPITLEYFMLMKFSKEATTDKSLEISYNDRRGLCKRKTCTPFCCCRDRAFTCGLFSKLIHFLCCNIFTMCCCQCEINENTTTKVISA